MVWKGRERGFYVKKKGGGGECEGASHILYIFPPTGVGSFLS